MEEAYAVMMRMVLPVLAIVAGAVLTMVAGRTLMGVTEAMVEDAVATALKLDVEQSAVAHDEDELVSVRPEVAVTAAWMENLVSVGLQVAQMEGTTAKMMVAPVASKVEARRMEGSRRMP